MWNRRSAFSQWFDRKTTTVESLKLVPPALHAQYRTLFDWLDARPLGRLQSQPAEVFAMQVLALFHQQFNRLGISINDETAYADLLAQYGTRGTEQPDADGARKRVASWVDYWSHNRVEA